MDIGLILSALRTKTPALITGGIGAGKTQTAEKIAAELKHRGITVGGILSPRVMEGKETVGYTVCDLTTGDERLFARLTLPGIPVGRFFIDSAGLQFARAAIRYAAQKAQVVFIDEVGRLELDGNGLADAVWAVLTGNVLPILLVRADLLTKVIRFFALSKFVKIDIGKEEF